MARTRLVEQLTIVGSPLAFAELAERAIPRETRFVVFDLDRTLHLGRNMGELLGWEVCAHQSYGEDYLTSLEASRTGGRVYLTPRRLRQSLGYTVRATRQWGVLGLFYLLWGKLGTRLPPLRRRTFQRFGPEPIRAIQRYAQQALLHRISSLPLEVVRELARRVWIRYGRDQTVERADIDALRVRCPGVKIIISSASSQPVLEIAARELGVDDIIYSSLEEHEGRLSAPCDRHPLSMPELLPHRITPPSKNHINAGRGKLAGLFARYPELRDPSVVSVGISDTGYGEDHCWAEAFTHLIDVNSTTPFPPIVAAGARVRRIVSAGLLTRGEKAARAAGNPGSVDPRRGEASLDRELGSDALARELAPVHAAIEALADQLEQREQAVAGERAAHEHAEAEAAELIERVVAEFNSGEGATRAEALRQLARELAARVEAGRRLARAERPVSAVAFSLTRELERARRLLGRGSL